MKKNIDFLNNPNFDKKLNMKKLLLSSPDEDISINLKNKIRLWGNEPSAIEILEVLEQSYKGNSSVVARQILKRLFDLKSESEKEKAINFANKKWRLKK